MEHATDWRAVGWAVGWLLAVLVLFAYGLGVPLAGAGGRFRRGWRAGAILLSGAAVALLAVAALTLNDTHVDLTREKLYTPSPLALAVAAGLREPVHITYFFQGQDPNARRTLALLKLMAQQNSRLTVEGIDPDKQPSLAMTKGVKIYNAALIRAGDRQVIVQGTDEAEVAVGIQRVLRERQVRVCFLAGHNEYASDNEEFHTHLENGAAHNHDDATAKVIETTGHGMGRLRRSLESIGYDIQRVPLATLAAVPGECGLVIDANPRTTWLPGESLALRHYLEQGGAVLWLLDLGFSLEPGLAKLLLDLGVAPLPAVVEDPLSHYGRDHEMVAVTGYSPHPITAHAAYSFYPGVRPLGMPPPVVGVTAVPLIMSGPASTVRAVAGIDRREVVPMPAGALTAGAQVLAVASEGRLAAGAKPFRVVVVGDADFASNSFYPYMANSDLSLAMVRWLAREETLTALNARVPVPALVLLTDSQLQAVYLVSAVGLPLLAVLGGLIVWWRRR
ncbi:MAG: hypothetical protein EXR83_08030 [Gammaproteobacteria bacterium]|nr:hypothetical protein [Gammaproteobacteria bacterium]